MLLLFSFMVRLTSLFWYDGKFASATLATARGDTEGENLDQQDKGIYAADTETGEIDKVDERMHGLDRIKRLSEFIPSLFLLVLYLAGSQTHLPRCSLLIPEPR